MQISKFLCITHKHVKVVYEKTAVLSLCQTAYANKLLCIFISLSR